MAATRGATPGVRTVLAGPAGHPLHALLAAVPVGAFVTSLVFDVLTRTREHGLPFLVDAAWWLIYVGLVGAVVVAVPGLVDLRALPRGAPVFTTAVRHVVLNAAAVAVFAVGFAWRASDHLEHDKTPWAQLALSAAAVALLAAATWLGGSLTYRHGVRVTAPPPGT
jgi:uncharacterized membrane protein